MAKFGDPIEKFDCKFSLGLGAVEIIFFVLGPVQTNQLLYQCGKISEKNAVEFNTRCTPYRKQKSSTLQPRAKHMMKDLVWSYLGIIEQ